MGRVLRYEQLAVMVRTAVDGTVDLARNVLTGSFHMKSTNFEKVPHLTPSDLPDFLHMCTKSGKSDEDMQNFSS